MLLALLSRQGADAGRIGATRCGARAVASAKWYGKPCTAFFELSKIALMFFPNCRALVKTIPRRLRRAELFSLVMYILFSCA
jgi:hypothetical protein